MSEGRQKSLISLREILQLENVINTNFSGNEQFLAFSNYIEELINYDFNRLVSILYRIDVSEEKVRRILAENTDKNAGELIATLILEREEEKIKFRELYSRK